MRVLKLPKCKRIGHLSFAPDGERIVVITSPVDDFVGSAVWLDVASGEPRQTIQLAAQRCAISSDHTRVALAYSPGARPGGVTHVRWADVPADGGEPKWNDLHGVPHNDVFSLTFSADGSRLVIGCASQKRHAIHIAPIGHGKAMTFPTDLLVGEVAFSADGGWMVVSGGAGSDPEVRFHRYPAPEPMAVYTPKATRTRRLVFAPDRSTLVALAGKLAILLQAGRAEPLAVMKGHTARVDDAAFTPDRRRLLTAGQDCTVQVWDANTGASVQTFTWPIGKLTAIDIAPDGLTAAAAGEKGQVVVWDLED